MNSSRDDIQEKISRFLRHNGILFIRMRKITHIALIHRIRVVYMYISKSDGEKSAERVRATDLQVHSSVFDVYQYLITSFYKPQMSELLPCTCSDLSPARRLGRAECCSDTALSLPLDTRDITIGMPLSTNSGELTNISLSSYHLTFHEYNRDY